ncbi:UNVERIFIED_CONTAM: hypothetical protein GTU68_009562 [Idotea baltica]|nr:hypothetical protein [Idotea baltica]
MSGTPPVKRNLVVFEMAITSKRTVPLSCSMSPPESLTKMFLTGIEI